jgi:outer membrane protein TolC
MNYLIQTGLIQFSRAIIILLSIIYSTSAGASTQFPHTFETVPIKPTVQPTNTSVPKKPQLKLALANVVYLVIENNTSIKNAYLDRIAQKGELAVQEDKFFPDFTPTVSVNVNQLGRNGLTSGSLDTSLGAKVVMRIPTGAEVTFNWTADAQTSNPNSNLNSNLNNIGGSINDNSLRQNLELRLSQPLLKNAGTRINQVSIDLARISEKSNIENLKSTLNITITDAIIAYRDLIRAQERVKIEQLSLKNAQDSLEINQALIQAGRLAPVDIIQNQTDIANRKVSLLSAQNDLESKRLALLSILDIDKNTDIEAETISSVKPVALDIDKLRKIVFSTQPGYLQAQFSVDQDKLNLMLAEDNKRWDLNLNATLLNNINQPTDARVGLSLTRNFGDLTLDQTFKRTQVELQKSENTLKDLQTKLDIDLQDGVRNANLSYKQLELAQQATQLSQQQLEIEQEKLKLGKGSGVFQLIRLQNELAQARNTELDATIGYLNALTNLDKFLGTTLQTWQVKIDK